jgi:MFS family permease
MAAGALIGPAALLAAAGAHSLTAVALALGVAFGVGVAMVFVPSLLLVRRVAVTKEGLMTGVASSGAGFGSLVYGIAASPMVRSLGWRSSLRWTAVAMFMVLMVASILARSVQRQAESAHQDRTERPTSSKLAVLIVCCLVAGTSYYIPFVLLASSIESRGLGRFVVSGALAVLALSNGISRLVIGLASDSRPRTPLLHLSLGAMALGAGLLSIEASPAVYLIGAIAFGFGAGGFVALIPPIAHARTLAGQSRGIALGSVYSAMGLGALAGPALASSLVDSYGYGLPLGLASALMIAASAVLFLGDTVYRVR